MLPESFCKRKSRKSLNKFSRGESIITKNSTLSSMMSKPELLANCKLLRQTGWKILTLRWNKGSKNSWVFKWRVNPTTKEFLSNSAYRRVLISKTWRLLITTFSTKCITSRKRLQRPTKREIHIILAHSKDSNINQTRLIKFLVT